MEKNKLIRVFTSLTPDELRFLKRFLESKIYNQHKKVIELFDHLRKQTTKEKPNLSKELIHKKLYPKTAYNDKQIRDVMSYLFKSIEQFLAYNENKTETSRELLALCRAYRKKGLMRLFETTTRKMKTLNTESVKRDLEYHEFNYRIEEEQYFAIVKKGRTQANNLQVVSNTLDISYFVNRLRRSCIMLSHQSVYNVQYEMGMIDAVIKEVERQELLHIPAISVYYYSYQAQTKTDNLYYFLKLQQSLKTCNELFDLEEMKDIYVLAINIGIKKLNQGGLELIEVLLELYKSGVAKKILLLQGKISPFTFKNTIALALRLHQFEWVEQFIAQFRLLIDSNHSEVIYTYNLAKLHYARKSYADALQLLSHTSSSGDLYVRLDTKILLSRIYYEQNDLDALENLIDSFKVFIRRNQIITYHQRSYTNFLNSLSKLVTTNLYDKEAKLALRENIEQLQPLPDKYWFLDQLD